MGYVLVIGIQMNFIKISDIKTIGMNALLQRAFTYIGKKPKKILSGFY